MQKIQDRGGNKAYKTFMSWVVEGNTPNIISHIELFITMKMKNNFCNENQYEMQKSQDGGGNKAYKIFASQVEEGNNPNTVSYVELFMTTMKMKK